MTKTTATPTGGSRWFDLRVIASMWRREVVRWRRDRSQIFGAVSRTLLWLVILGFGLGATLKEIEGYTYAQYILPGVVTLNVLFASLQSAIALVWSRQVGLLREVLVSPAPMLSVALGKICGGATVAVIQGTIPPLLAPVIGVRFGVLDLLLAWAIMFAMGMAITAVGVILACSMRTFEGFGSISNGVIQPLYFLSGAIFPLKGIIGGVGFLDIPQSLREELNRYGVYSIGGGWVVELPTWLKVLVYANPVSYMLDLLRLVTLGLSQLPIAVNLLAVLAFPPLAVMFAARAISALRRT
jgi:ABC-2 type transport system permease protein